MRSGFATLMVVLTVVTAPAAATMSPAGTFLMTAFHLSSAEMERLDGHQVFTRTLDTKNRRELATLGIVRVAASPSAYVERLADIVSFKKTDDVLQIGKFSTPPQLQDVVSLTLDEADAKRLRDCKVGDCDVRLDAEGIDRARQEIDWRAPDAGVQATRFVRQLLVSYVARYGQSGQTAAMEYADREPPLNVGREFASLLDADTLTSQHAPLLRRHLVDYPAASPATITDFIYWSKELVRGRPVTSITHVSTAAIADSPVAYAIASKQIYAMHYYDASLGLTLLLHDRASGSHATYIVYLNRSRIDLFDGAFGGIARRLVGSRARTVVAEQLQRLQRVLAPASPPTHR
jgi:hypothetical protein